MVADEDLRRDERSRESREPPEPEDVGDGARSGGGAEASVDASEETPRGPDAPGAAPAPDDTETAPDDTEAAPDDADAGDELSRLRRERDELRDMIQRVQAEFENFRKRVMRDQAARFERANDELVEALLPVLDSFELAVLNIPEADLDESESKLRKGVELVYAELLGVLEKSGLERIEAEGRSFDPEEHEAVLREGEGDTVSEVMRTGYRLKGRVLRPAMVKVGDRAPESREH